MKPKKLPLNQYECRKVSNGVIEQGVIEHIFNTLKLDPAQSFAVEFGGGDGVNNTLIRHMIEQGCAALLIEGSETLGKQLITNYSNNEKVTAINTFITAENLQDLFDQGNVPKLIDFLSIDLDGNDYYLWKSLDRYDAKIVCIEYNASYGPDQDFCIEYDPQFCWQGDDYMGASFSVFLRLGQEKGYELIHCSSGGDNMFFVKKEFAQLFPRLEDPRDYYQLPQYGRYGRAYHGCFATQY
jgi:hypothetical protein